MEEKKYWIWLSKILNQKPKTYIKLIEKYNSPERLWNITKQELIKDNIPSKLIELLTNKKYKQNLDKYIEYMQANKIDIITIKDSKYPKKLLNIYDKPAVIYVKGNKNILNNDGISIIGCRLCSKYGKNIAKKFAYDLSLYNINIISGLAKGIDAYSHLGALEAKGNTIAVVGTGLDRVYPKENKYIEEKIIQTGGAIISEYIIGTKPLAKNFPARNRLISGLSKGVLVVEAKAKSGTLITVDFALEQGKEIYIIPGNIDSVNSIRDK